MTEIINAKVVNHHALEKDWQNIDYIPEVGEIVFYDAEIDENGQPDASKAPEGREPITYTRQKNGDGVHNVKDLPFASVEGSNTPAQIVQSDWSVSNPNSAAYIKNKPTIPDALADLASDSLHRTVTDAEKKSWSEKSNFSGSYNDLTNTPTIPKSLADLTDDVEHRTVTDKEKADWNAKSTFSGSYNDLTDKPEFPSLEEFATKEYVRNNTPKSLADLADDAEHRTVTDAEKENWNTTIRLAGIEAGLVKSGGDVNIDEGIISLKDIGEYATTLTQIWSGSTGAAIERQIILPHPEASLIKDSVGLIEGHANITYFDGMGPEQEYYSDDHGGPFSIENSSMEQVFEIPLEQIEWAASVPQGADIVINTFEVYLPTSAPENHKSEYVGENHYRLSNGVEFKVGSSVKVEGDKIVLKIPYQYPIQYAMDFCVYLNLEWQIQDYIEQNEMVCELKEENDEFQVQIRAKNQSGPYRFTSYRIKIGYDVTLPCGLNVNKTPRFSTLEFEAIRPILKNSIAPTTNGAYDFGSADKKWNSIYANYLHGVADSAIYDTTGRSIVDTYAEKAVVEGLIEELAERLHNTNSKIYGNTWVLNDTIALDFDFYKNDKLYDFKFTTANGETFYGISIENTKKHQSSMKGYYKISYKKSSDLDEWIEVYRQDENGSRWLDKIPNDYKIITTPSTIILDTIGVQETYEGNLSTNSETIVGAINELALYGGTGKYIKTEDGQEYWQTTSSVKDLLGVKFGLDANAGLVIIEGVCWGLSKLGNVLGYGDTVGALYDLLGEVAEDLGEDVSSVTAKKFGKLASNGACQLGDQFVLDGKNVIRYGDNKAVTLESIIEAISGPLS